MKVYKKGYKKRVFECPECGCIFDASEEKEFHKMVYVNKICIKCPDCGFLMIAEDIDKNKLYELFGTSIPIEQEELKNE